MAEKSTLYIDSQTGKILGPSEVIGHLFANPKMKSWYGPPESMMVISDPQRFQKTLERLRQLGYPLVEKSPPDLPAESSPPPEALSGRGAVRLTQARGAAYAQQREALRACGRRTAAP